MSIILKGIDLPKDIDELRLIINGMSIAIEPTKAIQIPKGHGRLIDGGELQKDFENCCSGECDCCVHETKDYNCGLIANAPTILDEEGETK